MARPLKPSVNIQNLLSVERVLIINKHTEKNELIEKLVRKIADDYPDLPADFLLEKILQREQGISTTMDTGLSIPHARVDGIDNFIVALAVAPEGIMDPATPGVPIKVVFLFLSPSDAAFFQKHLQLLSLLSAKFQPEFVERLVSLKTAAQIMHAVAGSV
ncbi:MAG: PTS sugar transporter subunit IIA [Elusimicrobiaceae bacterium]|nr:PTS sugar transporter subunit IIA [Elusimicrobiaceae bacterium]